MLGVAALIIVMSVMNGFRAELFDKIVGLNGHAVVQGYGGRLADWRADRSSRRGATPGRHRRPAADRAAADGELRGPGRRRPACAACSARTSSRNPTLQRQGPRRLARGASRPASDNVAIGARLAEALGANVGGQISLIRPEGRTTPFGTVPRIVAYNVAAIFEVGVYDYDKAFVIMPIEDAQTFLMIGDAVGMVEVETVDADRVGEILAPLRAQRRRPGGGRRLALDELGPVRGAAGRAGGDVRRPLDHHPGRGVQHPLLADHAGPRQDPRHRHPANHGRDPRAG